MKIPLLQPAKPKFLLSVLDGGSLERRVLRLIEAKLPWARRWRVFAAGCCGFVLVSASAGVGMLSVHASAAQESVTYPRATAAKFDVVSIKRNNSGEEVAYLGANKTGYATHNLPLIRVIVQAYLGSMAVPVERVKDAPSWVMNEPYDITAKADEATIAAMKDMRQAQLIALEAPMLRAMLEDRCKLVVHTVPVEVQGYALVVGKHGIKMTEAKPDELLPAQGIRMAEGWMMVPMQPGTGAKQSVGYRQMTMAQLAISMGLGPIPVVDQTGLTGKYDFDLPKVAPPEPADSSAPRPPVDISQMYDLSAIGLELKPIKVPSKDIVIDHIERPTEN